MQLAIKQAKSTSYKILSATIIFMIAWFAAFSTEPVATDSSSEHHKEAEGKFNPGKLVMEHISDAHEWHIYGSEENPVSIPLPVIIYSKQKGLTVFSSSRFEHGKAYKGYKLE